MNISQLNFNKMDDINCFQIRRRWINSYLFKNILRVEIYFYYRINLIFRRGEREAGINGLQLLENFELKQSDITISQCMK